MEDHAKTQALVVAVRDADRFTDLLRQGVQLAVENSGYVLAREEAPLGAIGAGQPSRISRSGLTT